MWRYLELLSFRPMSEIESWRVEIEQGLNPRDVKIRLAKELVGRFHDEAAAEAAHQTFVSRFQKGQIPDEMAEFELSAGEGLPIANLLRDVGLVKSTSEAMRMIKQGAVKIDGEKIGDTKLRLESGEGLVCQVGKRRFARVTLV
jgi:tyrosyl-tRNA synthetase